MTRLTIVIAILLVTAIGLRAETIDVSDSHGGVVSDYAARWSALAAQGVNVRIVGPCQSACTVLFGYIPHDRICVTPAASFGFHLAKTAKSTAMLLGAYSSDIQAWIDQHGGLKSTFIWMRAPDTYRFFKKC
jgi:hypothetical protein